MWQRNIHYLSYNTTMDAVLRLVRYSSEKYEVMESGGGRSLHTVLLSLIIRK